MESFHEGWGMPCTCLCPDHRFDRGTKACHESENMSCSCFLSRLLSVQDAGIGQNHALFYEAAATHAELKQDFERASLIFEEGCAVGATPLERLQAKHAAFKQRMVSVQCFPRLERSVRAQVVS